MVWRWDGGGMRHDALGATHVWWMWCGAAHHVLLDVMRGVAWMGRGRTSLDMVKHQWSKGIWVVLLLGVLVFETCCWVGDVLLLTCKQWQVDVGLQLCTAFKRCAHKKTTQQQFSLCTSMLHF